MKKYGAFVAAFLMCILLSGCISISLSDGGTLEISSDGIQVVNGTEDVGEVANSEETGKEVGKEGINEEESDASLAGEGFGGCDNEFYLLGNRILDDFPLTPCPEFKSIEIQVDKNRREVSANYMVFAGIYDEYELYKAYFINKGYEFESERVRGEWGGLEVKDNQMKMAVEVSMIGNDNFETAMVELNYTESPARAHKVVDSIVNWNEETGYGQCEDEYYILTGNMLKDFPFEPCVELSFLRVDFGETQNGVRAVYSTEGGTVEELSELYKNYFVDRGNVWELYGESDDADATILVDYEGTRLSMKLTEQADGRVGIDLDYVEVLD